MKKCSIVLFFLMTFSAFGQKGYVIEGKVEHAAPNARVELMRWYGNMGTPVAVDTIRDGKFLIRGEIGDQPVRMTMSITGDSSFYGERTLWVGNQVTQIEGNSFCVALWKVESSLKQQQEENQYAGYAARYIQMYERFFKEAEQEYRAELRDQRQKQPQMTDYPVLRRLDSLRNLKLQADIAMLESSRVISEVGLERLYPMARMLKYSKKQVVCPELVKKLFMRLDTTLENTARAAEIYSYLYPYKVAEVGDEMVDGILFDLDGNKHRLTDFKGRYMLLDFWSSGCGPCRLAQPELEEVAERYRDSVWVIGISLDVDKEIWREASGSLAGINLSDLKGEGGIVARYGYVGMPEFVIINPEGIVVAKWFGYSRNLIKSELQKCMKRDNYGPKNQ